MGSKFNRDKLRDFKPADRRRNLISPNKTEASKVEFSTTWKARSDKDLEN